LKKGKSVRNVIAATETGNVNVIVIVVTGENVRETATEIGKGIETGIGVKEIGKE